jgi:hypothetical protein
VRVLIERVSRFERISADGLMRDLTLAGFDVLRVRVSDTDAAGIMLDTALGIIKEGRAALVAAASATAAGIPRRNYAGRQPESVGQFLDRVRVGQTEKGSFVVPLLSPYAFDIAENQSLPGEWFGRRVMRKLTQAFVAVDNALGADDGSNITNFLSAAPRGVSANLCQALGRLVETAGGVELTVGWALAAPERTTPSLSLSPTSASTLLRAASSLAEVDPPPSEPLIGFVTRLDDTAGPARATLETWIEGKLRNVSCYFDDTLRNVFSEGWEYRRAVLVAGDLQREGKKLSIPRVSEAYPVDLPEEEEEEGAERALVSSKHR